MPEDVKIKAELTVVLVFFVLLTAIGAIAGGLAVQDFARARASLSWQSVDGVALSDGEPGELEYAYIVNGRSYESRRVRFFAGRFSPAPDVNFQPGERVEVFFDANNPALSVVRPGGSGLVFFVAVVLSGVLVFFGIGGLIRTLMIVRAEEERLALPHFEADAAS